MTSEPSTNALVRSLASQARPRLARGTTSVPEIDEEIAPGSPSVPHPTLEEISSSMPL
jgi:hypothetical protein